jgi:acyl dehydratase
MPRIIEGVEELRSLVGQEVAVSDWLEVTQPMINAFADVTRDHQWLHVDVDRARTDSPFGATIAHGFYTLSLLSHLASQALKVNAGFKMGVNYGLNRVRFTAPVPSGSRIRGRFKLLSVDRFDWGIQLLWSATVEVEDATRPSMVAEWVIRYYR